MNAKLGGVRSFLQVSVMDSPAATKGKPVKAVVAKHADKKAAEMPAMLGLLKGMYASWKEKIGTANKREKEEKNTFDEEIKNLEAKKKKFKDDVNATKTYDGIEK